MILWLGKPLYYRYTNPASLGVGIISEGNGKFNPFLSTGAGDFCLRSLCIFMKNTGFFSQKNEENYRICAFAHNGVEFGITVCYDLTISICPNGYFCVFRTSFDLL